MTNAAAYCIVVSLAQEQSDQMIKNKNCQIFLKNSPESHQVKRSQNIYNKAQFENPKHLYQTTFKTLKYLQQIMF
jgi:hypothetical protein